MAELRPSDVIAAVRLLAAQTHTAVSFEGTIVPDSWNLATGTVDVLVGDTAAFTDEDSDEPLVLRDVPADVPAYGFQYGAVGGERVVVKTAGGADWRYLINHGEDDSPQTPAGEHYWVRFAKGLADLAVQSFIKHTNSGESVGDAKGGLRLGSAFISFVGDLIMLGAEGLDKTKRGAMTKEDGDNLAAGIIQAVNDWAATHVQPGSGAPPITQTVEATGSTTVKIAP